MISERSHIYKKSKKPLYPDIGDVACFRDPGRDQIFLENTPSQTTPRPVSVATKINIYWKHYPPVRLSGIILIYTINIDEHISLKPFTINN